MDSKCWILHQVVYMEDSEQNIYLCFCEFGYCSFIRRLSSLVYFRWEFSSAPTYRQEFLDTRQNIHPHRQHLLPISNKHNRLQLPRLFPRQLTASINRGQRYATGELAVRAVSVLLTCTSFFPFSNIAIG
jgi:hypothetical protein